jgi:hypothetical protein
LETQNFSRTGNRDKTPHSVWMLNVVRQDKGAVASFLPPPCCDQLSEYVANRVCIRRIRIPDFYWTLLGCTLPVAVIRRQLKPQLPG